ncbi:FAD-dependent oxidoreductase [Actinomadura harenae]|uniref:Pyridine nucleotide-disulfide oxidoreductase n=1 Tax=Actinomadura harenae TaxID=2483351 RepID=A0A3M2M627_9ACTN|nr:FAD-dependent oxidoreductase [Actinomadura harenae]RMI44962.1 pyridine nucleotide-disulfide oxidoreductase [Actinomadura harenae]
MTALTDKTAAEGDAALQADLLVIGFGKGGKTLASALGRKGQRVVLVEQSDQMYGGTCINIGCVPTKALVHRSGERPGADDPAVWFEKNARDVQDLTAFLNQKNYAMLDGIDTVTVVTGKARFLGPETVEVRAGDDRLLVSAGAIVVNTGAVPVVPPIPGLRESAHLATSTDLLRGTELPRHLAVIGGGPLGLEFAQMYRRFGSEVTVLESSPRLAGREDDDIAGTLAAILTGDGIRVVTGASVTEVEDTEGGAIVRYEIEGTKGEVLVDRVLAATGRRPATNGLGLDAAGVELTERGAIAVDEHLRASNPRVFAIGDVNGGPQFTYISLDDHRIVADQLVGSGRRSTADRRAVPTTTFITPPLSTVGLTEKAAREAGHNVKVAAKPVAQIAAMPRARIVGETRGLFKVVVDADTDLVLGAALLGTDSQEMINTIALAIRHDVTATELRDAIYTHPSATEALNEVLGLL